MEDRDRDRAANCTAFRLKKYNESNCKNLSGIFIFVKKPLRPLFSMVKSFQEGEKGRVKSGYYSISSYSLGSQCILAGSNISSSYFEVFSY